VQDIYGFLELGDVHHPIDAAGLPNADFLGAGPDIIERLPVIRVQTNLDLTQLETSGTTWVVRECQQVVVGGTHPANLFFVAHHFTLYKILYTSRTEVKRFKRGTYWAGAPAIASSIVCSQSNAVPHARAALQQITQHVGAQAVGTLREFTRFL
jgi:hypothetical protein